MLEFTQFIFWTCVRYWLKPEFYTVTLTNALKPPKTVFVHWNALDTTLLEILVSKKTPKMVEIWKVFQIFIPREAPSSKKLSAEPLEKRPKIKTLVHDTAELAKTFKNYAEMLTQMSEKLETSIENGRCDLGLVMKQSIFIFKIRKI